MKVVIVYPLPFDEFATYCDPMDCFIESFKTYPPGHDYVLHVTCHWGEPSDSIRERFYGIKTKFEPYYANGRDIGACQSVAQMADNALVLGLTSRCYFHRAGWLARFVEARMKYGPGLYGTAGSWEGGRPHIRTVGYLMDSQLWQVFPYDVTTHELGHEFECGEKSLTHFVSEKGLPIMQVTWDREHGPNLWRDPSEEAIYRRGGQAAMLLWDKHTDAYREADDAEKTRLTALADPPSA